MTGVAFIKMQGLGNDFVVFDGRSTPIELDPARLRAIADRRCGVGCDQIIVIQPGADGVDASMEIRNADGGAAEATRAAGYHRDASIQSLHSRSSCVWSSCSSQGHCLQA